jgi:predicted TIM-barrel fold metal-dependent hydrolase
MAHTPWGDLPVSDAHVHFFSHAFYSALARQKKAHGAEALGPLLGWEIPDPDPVKLAERWVAELDAHDVHSASLIASAPGDETSVAAAVAAFPDRFHGYFLFDATAADAVERATRAAADPHLHCLCLFPAMHRYSVNDARLEPVFEIAQAHHLAVFVHCGVLSVGVRKKLGLASPYDMRYSNPVDLHPVANRFPDLRFVVPHFGAGMFREALMLASLCPNVWLDTSSSNQWMSYEGLDLRTVFRRAIDVAGVERLLFGTDSSFLPRGWQAPILEQQARALYELGLKEAQARLVLGENLGHLLRH